MNMAMLYYVSTHLVILMMIAAAVMILSARSFRGRGAVGAWLLSALLGMGLIQSVEFSNLPPEADIRNAVMVVAQICFLAANAFLLGFGVIMSLRRDGNEAARTAEAGTDPRPPPRRNPVRQVSKGLFVSMVGIGWGAAIILMLIGLAKAKERVPESALVFYGISIPISLLGGIFFLVIVHRMWAAIQDGYARTTPGSAVGMLFVPFYNVYWVFQALPGFATDFNRFAQRHRIPGPPLPRGLFLIYCILVFFTWIPVLGVALQFVLFPVGLAIVATACDAINRVAAAGAHG